MYYFEKKSILLFDGVCNLCNTSVNFVIKHDTKKQFLFASLQSDAAKELLLHYGIKNLGIKSIILIHNHNIYTKSTAIFLIFRYLNKGLKFCYIGIIIPKFIRDTVYDFVSKHRYKWFGRKQKCMLPTKELKNRFIQ